MRLEIDISPLAAQMFGENPAQKIADVAEREALRLWYIERSKPKPPVAPRPVGRPPLNPEEKRFRELSERLEAIYHKREEQLGSDFQAVLGAEYKRLIEAIDSHDLRELELIEQEKPWITRKW